MSARRRRPLERLHAADLTNLAVEAPDTPMHLGALIVLDGRALCAADGGFRLADVRADADQHPDLAVLVAAMERDWATLTARAATG